MTELQGLIETDRLATLSINGSESLFWDGVANYLTVNQKHRPQETAFGTAYGGTDSRFV